MSWNGSEHNVLLRNIGPSADGIPRFVDVALAVGADAIADARGLAIVDIDNDGDEDLIVNNNPGDQGLPSIAPTLLRNDIGSHRNWLAVKLEGTRGNRDAIGAIVDLELDRAVSDLAGAPTRVTRHVMVGSGYASQNSQRLTFGLGAAQRATKLTVTWPGGEQEIHENIEGGYLWKIRQGDSPVRAQPGKGR